MIPRHFLGNGKNIHSYFFVGRMSHMRNNFSTCYRNGNCTHLTGDDNKTRLESIWNFIIEIRVSYELILLDKFHG